MRPPLFIFFSLLWFVCHSQIVEAQKDSAKVEDLDEVIVTATRTERQLSSLPLPVTLVGKEQLQQTGVIRLNEILSEQTGIIMVPDFTVGGQEGVQIQGISSDYVLVLIDGVPVVGRSSGNLDLSRLAVGNIKQIEVVKGPSSSLFGSEALGGVINIITEKPSSDSISGNASHRAESFNGQNTTVSLGQQLNRVGYSFFADRLSTDGFDLSPVLEGQTNAPFSSYTLHGRVFFDASEKLSFFGSARYFQRDFDVDPNTSAEEEGNLHIRADHDPSDKVTFQYELYYTNYVTDELSVDPIDDTVLFQNDFDQRLLRPEVRFSYQLSRKGTLTSGVGVNFEKLSRTLFADDVSFDSQYAFTQYDYQPTKKLNVIVGARFDNHSEYNSQFSPKLSVRYQVTDELALKGSVGSGFKAPDFRQLYLDFTNALGGGYSVFGKEVEVVGIQRLADAGNILTDSNGDLALQVPPEDLGEPLSAESSVGYNLGLSCTAGGFKGSVNAFRNDFKDLIDTQVIATKSNGANVFGYINRARVYFQGVELDMSYRLLENLRVSAGYQLLYAYDKDIEDQVEAGAFARDPVTNESIRISSSEYFGLENRSRHTINGKLFLEAPKWQANANLRVIYRSKYGLTDTNGNGFLDDYDTSFADGFAIANFSAAKTLFKNYQLQIGANNLFNFKGTNPISSTLNDGTFNRTLLDPGRRLFTRLTIQF